MKKKFNIPRFATPGSKQCPCPVSTQIVCVRLYSGASGQAKRSSNSINSSSFMRFRKWNFLDKKHLSFCITGQKQSFPWILGNRLGCASEVGAASFGWTAWSVSGLPWGERFCQNGRRQHWETTRLSSSGKAIRAHWLLVWVVFNRLRLSKRQHTCDMGANFILGQGDTNWWKFGKWLWGIESHILALWHCLQYQSSCCKTF